MPFNFMHPAFKGLHVSFW